MCPREVFCRIRRRASQPLSKNIMTITHTNDSLKVTEFAQKYPGWHSYAKDKRTTKAVERARDLGAVEISYTTRQFKYAR